MHKNRSLIIALIVTTLTVAPAFAASANSDHAPTVTGWTSSLVEWFKAALTEQSNNGDGNKPVAYTVAKTGDEENKGNEKPGASTAAKTTDQEDEGGNNKPGA